MPTIRAVGPFNLDLMILAYMILPYYLYHLTATIQADPD
jgi:hypothetical protein